MAEVERPKSFSDTTKANKGGCNNVKRLENRVAIITGVASGVGRVAALLFAKEDAKVVATDISAEEGEKQSKRSKRL